MSKTMKIEINTLPYSDYFICSEQGKDTDLDVFSQINTLAKAKEHALATGHMVWHHKCFSDEIVPTLAEDEQS